MGYSPQGHKESNMTETTQHTAGTDLLIDVRLFNEKQKMLLGKIKEENRMSCIAYGLDDVMLNFNYFKISVQVKVASLPFLQTFK